MIPSCIQLYHSGELAGRSSKLNEILASCTLCPRACGVNRLRGGTGFCRAAANPAIASAAPHFGEEPPLTGTGGSGTIFFTGCNLACIYCQNYDISQLNEGRSITADQLARVMLVLQAKGCHNINFVTPTHMTAAIVEALLIAVPGGLRVPLVYNSGGYDSVETLRLLDGVFDIYMPDIKYGDDETG